MYGGNYLVRGGADTQREGEALRDRQAFNESAQIIGRVKTAS